MNEGREQREERSFRGHPRAVFLNVLWAPGLLRELRKLRTLRNAQACRSWCPISGVPGSPAPIQGLKVTNI